MKVFFVKLTQIGRIRYFKIATLKKCIALAECRDQAGTDLPRWCLLSFVHSDNKRLFSGAKRAI